MKLKNTTTKLLTLVMLFVFSGIAAQVSAQRSWLDEAAIKNWNSTTDTLPKTKKNARAELRRCSSYVRQPSLPEDFFLTNNGHTLTGAAEVYGTTTLVTTADAFDEKCRPRLYQTYVFSKGKLAGTISPEPMNWEADGASIDLILAKEDYLLVKFARYRDSDERCCPYKTKIVTYQIRQTDNNRSLLVPTSGSENSYYGAFLPSYSADDLKRGVWRWENSMSAFNSTTVDKPENYTIEFAPNGQLKVRADCNQGFGKYQANDGVLTLSQIGVTRRACAPGSMDTAFLSNLNKAQNFRIENDVLVIELSDKSEMRFSRTENGNSANELENTTWYWENAKNSEGEISVDEPKKYQISFKPNGELILISDCNRGGGKYEVRGNKLKISSTFLTLMSCGENSLETRFTQHLEGNKKFRIADDNLFVEDVDGKKIMKFVRGRY